MANTTMANTTPSTQVTIPIPFNIPLTPGTSPILFPQTSIGNVPGLNLSGQLGSQLPNVVNGTFGVSMYPMVMANESFAPQYVSSNPPYLPPYLPAQNYNPYYSVSYAPPLTHEVQGYQPWPRAPEVHYHSQYQCPASLEKKWKSV